MSHHIVILVLIGALFTNVSILGTNASKSYRKTLEFKKVAARPNFKVETAGLKGEGRRTHSRSRDTKSGCYAACDRKPPSATVN